MQSVVNWTFCFASIILYRGWTTVEKVAPSDSPIDALILGDSKSSNTMLDGSHNPTGGKMSKRSRTKGSTEGGRSKSGASPNGRSIQQSPTDNDRVVESKPEEYLRTKTDARELEVSPPQTDWEIEGEHRKLRMEAFWRTRDELTKRELSNTENLDRSILTLASGALGVSVTFLNAHQGEAFFGLLVASWLAFGVSIIGTLVSYHVSQKSIALKIDQFEEYYLRENEGALAQPDEWGKWNDRLVLISTIVFAVGILLMVLYFGLRHRLPEAASMHHQSSAVDASRTTRAAGSESQSV